MKKIFQYTKKIFVKRFIRKIFALWIFFGVGSIFFQTNVLAPQVVYAETTDNTENILANKTRNLNTFLKIIYVLLWPFLALAWLTLDNGMVYGSYLNLDAPLWMFWNIIKNFANFALGFLVLVSIIKSIFAWFKESDITGADWPFGVIKKALVAGILIQMSRFLLAAVIDISTVATYAIWWLPLSVMKESDDIGKKPILWVHTNFNLKEYENINEYSENFEIRYSYWQSDNISKCEVKEGKYIVGRMNWSQIYDNSKQASSLWSPTDWHYQICVYWGTLYAFIEHNSLSVDTADEYNTQRDVLRGSHDEYFKWSESINPNCSKYDDLNYQNKASVEDVIDILNKKRWNGETSAMSSELPVFWVNLSNCESKILWKAEWALWLLWERDSGVWMTMNTMLTDLEWFTWPLVTMYASVMNFAEISNVPKEWENLWAMWIELLIKTIFALALIMPLAMITIVLIARVGILWLAIAFMPFLILAWTFFDKNDGIKKLLEWIKITTLWELIKIIFAPVIIVFSVSLSLIFMTALTNTLGNDTKQHEFFESLWIYDSDTEEVNILNLVTNEMNGNNTWSDLDNILSFTSRLFTNLFAIWIMWALLFAAIKATKLWETIVDKVGADKLLWQTLGAIPIMHVGPNKTGVWVNALLNTVPGALWEHLENMTNKEKTALDQYFAGNAEKNSITISDVQRVSKLKQLWYSDNDIEKLVGKKVSDVKWSDVWETHFKNIDDGISESTGLSDKIINQTDTIKMSKTNIEHAMNSGKLSLAADTWVVAAGGKHYIVHQTAAAFGGYHFSLLPVPDDVNASDWISDEERQQILDANKDYLESIKKDQSDLYQSNKDIIDQMRRSHGNKFADNFADMVENYSPPVADDNSNDDSNNNNNDNNDET